MHTYLCHDWGRLGEGYGDLPVPWFVTSWESITTSKIKEFLKSKGITHTHTLMLNSRASQTFLHPRGWGWGTQTGAELK